MEKAPPNFSFPEKQIIQNNESLAPAYNLDDLPLFASVKETEVDGIGMGVLNNGIPYLSQKGLARFCGIDNKTLRTLVSGWDEEKAKPRGLKIQQYLEQYQYDFPYLYIRVEKSDKSKIHAFPDSVCMAILEYYAFDQQNETAIKNYRLLAKTSLRGFIYSVVGYDPNSASLESWQYYHDRVSLVQNKVPDGYFCIFSEISGLIVDLITCGLKINSQVIPDISVGKSWASYWAVRDLDYTYGTPIEYEHNYPEYYPQSLSNPQHPKAYPNSSLGEFRDWFRHQYLPLKFPGYISKKANFIEGDGEGIKTLIDTFKLNLIQK